MNITELLQHPLIQKYFGIPSPDCNVFGSTCGMCARATAYTILSAMCEPLKLGQKILQYISDDWQYTDLKSETHIGSSQYHPTVLVLPSQFQPRRECNHDGYLKCVNCGINWTDGHEVVKKPSPSDEAVEKKLMAIAMSHGAISGGWEHDLRELVRLVREGK